MATKKTAKNNSSSKTSESPKPISAPVAKKVQFEFFAPDAKNVVVAGSFNNWKPEEAKLVRSRDGKWTGVLDLSPGRYEYRYVVDGRWCCDQRPVDCVPNPFGSTNSVVVVK